MKKYIGIALLTISLLYSIEFYIQISLSFAVFIIAFEICKLILLRQDNTLKVKAIIFTCSLLIVFGFIANTVNKLEISEEKQYKQVTNEAHAKYLSDKDLLEKQIEEAKNQVNNYPTFESLGLSKWEDKTESYKNWNNQKSILNDNYNKLITELNEIKKPAQFKRIKIKSTGFNTLFSFLHIQKNILLICLSIIVSLIMEMLQYEFMKSCKKVVKEEIVLNGLGRKKYRLGRKILTSKLKNLNPIIENPNHNIVSPLETTSIEGIRSKEVRAKNPNPIRTLGEENPNPIINLNEVRSTKDEKILTKIEAFISENFKTGEIIDRKKLLESLKIKEYDWKKIDKSKIRNIEKIGTKFKKM